MSENKVLSKQYEEFMSLPITVDDCEKLEFKPFDDGIGLNWGSLTFMFRESTNQFFVLHQALSVKSIRNPTRKQVDEVYHFFTEKHLDFNYVECYNWESCFSKHGWYVSGGSTLVETHSNLNIDSDHKCVYPTEEDAASALAHCQLLHIVNKINEDYPRKPEMGYDYFITVQEGKIRIDAILLAMYDTFGGLILNTREGAEILIRDNEPLLKIYFKIK